MEVLRVLSGVLSASSAGLALAERIGLSAADETRVLDVAVDPERVEESNVMYPSQSESAALLDAALGRARDSARLAAS